MNQPFTFLSAVILSASAVTFIASTKHNAPTIKNKGEISHDGTEDDVQDRIRWEVMRLADPATGKIPDNIRQKELAFAATLPNDAQGTSTRSLNLLNRGPWNVGGRTRAVGIDVTNENRILAGSTSGGMWLSTDGGTSWTMTTTSSQLKGATCVVQDTRINHRNTWYYGSGEGYGQSASANGNSNSYFQGDGLFKSTDNGVTWQPIASTAGGNPNTFTTNWQNVWNVVNDISANDTTQEIYAATLYAVYRSINGGNTWTTVLSGNSYYTDVAIDTAGVVYATQSSDGSQKGIWRSADGTPSTYVNITPSGFPATYNRLVIGINPSNKNEVYFFGNTPNSGKATHDYLGTPIYTSLWKYTYVSGDGSGAGGTWQNLSVNLPATGGVFDLLNTQNSYDMLVRVKPGSPNTVIIGGTNLYRSTTGFQDSTNTVQIGGYQVGAALPIVNSYLNHHPDQHNIVFYPSDPNKMLSSCDGGVFRTTDNTASPLVWTPLNNGYLTSMFYSVAIDHATPNNNIIVGGAQDNGTWYTNSAVPTTSWKYVNGGDGSFCAIADGQSAYYFSLQQGKMQKATLDASGNKTAYARMDPIGGKGYQFVNPFTLDPNNNNLMYLAGGKYLWRNNNLGGIPLVNNSDSISTNWTKFIDSVPAIGSKITAVTVCKTPANRVYYGTDAKKIYKVDNANVGTPTPVDITSTTTGVVFPSAYVNCIAVDPNDGNKLMVVFSNYNSYSLFYSTDGGLSWSKSGGNLEQNSSGTGNGPSIRWISILPVADGKVYLAATSVGLYATDTLNGLNTVWVQQGANTIGNAVCDMIDTRPSDGLVVIATHANGMYSTNITSINDITTVKEITSAKAELQLTNYPNPVSQSTTIEFTINKKTNVNLQVWDECGRLVETLVNESMSEGKHTVQFDKKNLNSGIYYYSLIADNKRKTNKMVIIK